ncbi:FecR family protein [Desertivirga arenae]|uniref:FecR family protein n=1 Tax=Desertivirga arenae TaxID=2810309 RepID=UPI001A960B70|nr:FecR family protein [Pedobacter sp. SYSU D00823]
MQKIDAKELLIKYREATASKEEKALLIDWLTQWRQDEETGLSEEDLLEERRLIWEGLPVKETKVLPLRRWAVAASILLAVSISAYFLLNGIYMRVPTASVYNNDIDPGTDKAILTLSDGRRIVLDNSAAGIVATEGNVSVKKTADGQIRYVVTEGQGSDNTGFNTISTPAGGQYQVLLPDGTKVWLNAASSLKFPASFSKGRKVELQGEAYFEVVKNKDKHFFVNSGKQLVEVMGTHFNVNAYKDEPALHTTLLEGSVKVSTAAESKLLVPGQESVLSASGLDLEQAKLDEVTAWKNGYFKFNGKDIRTIMREISRWYNVTVEYQGKITAETFDGRISRNRKLTEVLKLIESAGKVHFKVEGRRVTVMN